MTDEPTGFKQRTRLSEAHEAVRAAVAPHGRVEEVPLAAADGRVLATGVEAGRNVPDYARAAMDGYAVRAEDTFVASDRSPAVLELSEEAVAEAEAATVTTGDPLPAGADAVVRRERVDRRGGAVEVFDPVAEGDNVAPVGEDVDAGEHLFDPGAVLGPSALGLLKSVGVDAVPVAERPTVAVRPTGDELVDGDPDVGEVVETNALTVGALVERWGGDVDRREVVPDTRAALRSAIGDDLAHDVVVTAGGTSVGGDDLLPDLVAELGELVVHGVAVEPGHPMGVAVVDDTPVVLLPGYPVSAVVGAVQLLRPLLAWLQDAEPARLPGRPATLARKVPSEPGVRTFARVTVEEGMGGQRRATPTSTAGAGVLSSVALADGWVVVPESKEGVPSGETVLVQQWEGSS